MNRLFTATIILGIAIFGFTPVYAGAGMSTQKDDNYQNNDNYSDNNQQSDNYQDDNYQNNDNYSQDQQNNDNYSQDQQNDNSYNNNYPEENNYGNNYRDNYSSQNDYNYSPSGRVDSYTALNNYGQWVYVSPFGRCWRPDVAGNWRPFSQGHWVTTSYGQTWEGYEPWAWLTYHYGHWIFTREFGWVWIPGTDYTPGNVEWSYGPNSIGWTPTPPYGYDYSRGYLSYVGPSNQFSFYDSGFGLDFNFGYGYYPALYQPFFFSAAYTSICPNLWFFINRSQFLSINYANFFLGPTYIHNVFINKTVRISPRPLRRDVLQRIVQRPVPMVPVREQNFTLNGHRTKFVVPAGQEQRFRRNAPRVAQQVIRRTPFERRGVAPNRSSSNTIGMERPGNQRSIREQNQGFVTRAERDKQFQRREVPFRRMERNPDERNRMIQQEQRNSRNFYSQRNYTPQSRTDRRNEQFIRNERLQNQRMQPEARRNFGTQNFREQFRTESRRPNVTRTEPSNRFSQPQHYQPRNVYREPQVQHQNSPRMEPRQTRIEQPRQENTRQSRRENVPSSKKKKERPNHIPQ